MNEIELKKLWSKLSEKYDIGDWESFKSKMQTKEQRKKFYDKISEKMDIGSYDDFEKRLSQPQSQKQEPVVKKQEPIKVPEPVRKQVSVSDLDPQYQPNVQYNIPNKNTSNVQPNQPNKVPDKVTFKRITNPNDD